MKLLKYLLNFLFACLTIYIVFMSFGIIVEPPEDRDFMKVILDFTLILLAIFIILLGIITLINFLIERRVEKRQNSKEFVRLGMLHVFIFIVCIILCANDYYTRVSEIHTIKAYC